MCYNIIIKGTQNTDGGKQKMTMADIKKENDRRIEERINKEIDSCGMAYKVKDSEGNQFVFAGIANGGFPLYRGARGQKHIFDLIGYEVVEKYCSL